MDGKNARDVLDAARKLVVDTTMAESVEALRAVAIRSLVVRGPALATLLYDPPEARAYVDVDLLVDPSRFADAEAVLAKLGFTESRLEAALPSARPEHAHTWRASSGRSVDLHRTLLGIEASPEELWSALISDATQLVVGDTRVEIPSVAARALIVALHAAHHVNDPEQTKRDLDVALARLPQKEWSAAAELARRLQSLEAFVNGLSLSARGRDQLRFLGLEADNAREPATGGGDVVFHVAHALSRVANTHGARARGALLLRRLFPQPAAMRTRSRLARRGTVGLVLAYTARLLTAVRRLPAALRLLRQARR